MQYGILPFPCNVLFMHPFCHGFISLSRRFMCFSNTTESCLCFRCFGLSVFWNNGFPNAGFGELSFVSPTFTLHSWWCLCNVRRLNQQIKFSSNFWQIPVLVFRQPILAFLFFELLFQFSSKRQAICDLDLMSFDFWQSRPGPHPSFWRSFVQQRKSCKTCPWIWQTSVSVDIPIVVNSYFLSNNPNLYELTSWHQYTSVELGMTLLSTQKIELFVQYDDGKSRWMDQMSLWILASSFVSSGRNSSLTSWDSPLRSSFLTVDNRLRLDSWTS